MTPNLAQGANMAIESGAALSNKLHHLFQSKCKQNPSEAQIISMLEDFSHSHYMRARIINSLSQAMTRMLARDGVISTFLGRYIALRSDYFTSFWLSKMLGRGVKLDYVPVGRAPQRLLPKENGRVVIGFILIVFISVLFLYIPTRAVL
jgi:2-polyprenyl-6-methoxyphenol hydroxylase-like FAD-dependent oxidoreductase